jgi:hypothetical protein
MPAGEGDARHRAASTAKVRGSGLYEAGNFAQVRKKKAEILSLDERGHIASPGTFLKP